MKSQSKYLGPRYIVMDEVLVPMLIFQAHPNTSSDSAHNGREQEAEEDQLDKLIRLGEVTPFASLDDIQSRPSSSYFAKTEYELSREKGPSPVSKCALGGAGEGATSQASNIVIK